MHILSIPRHNFQKKCKKNFFFEFLKFFISDRIYTPKIMTNNLSHVLTSWLYTKKVCDMHVLCTPRPIKGSLCSQIPCNTITTAKFRVIWLLLLTYPFAVPAWQLDHQRPRRHLEQRLFDNKRTFSDVISSRSIRKFFRFMFGIHPLGR